MKEADVRPENLVLVHQVVWLMNEFPGKTINDFVDTFLVPEMPIYFANLTIWLARDLGYVVLDDPDFNGKGTYVVDRVPDEWNFGPKVEALRQYVPYFLGCLNAEESDISEGQLQAWFVSVGQQLSYTRYEYGVALKLLLNEGKIAQYTLKNVVYEELSKKAKGRGKKPKVSEDVYVYYTLPENLDKQWGRKQHPDEDIVE